MDAGLAAFDAEDHDDDALLEAARELDEHSSLVEYCCSGLEALCVQAGVYTEELALVSAACTKDMAKEPVGAGSMPSSEQGDLPKPRKTVMFADNHDPPFPRWEPSPHLDVQRLAMNSQQSAWAVAAQVAHAASAIQAAWKGSSVRLALAEAKALYNISLPAPPGFFRRIFGGGNTYDCAFCHRTCWYLGGIATPTPSRKCWFTLLLCQP